MRLLGERAEVAPMVERMCAFVASWAMLWVASLGSPAAPQEQLMVWSIMQVLPGQQCII